MPYLDPQVDLVIEVKGSKANVTVSWNEKEEEQQAKDVEMETNEHVQKKVISKKIAIVPFFWLSFFKTVFCSCTWAECINVSNFLIFNKNVLHVSFTEKQHLGSS